MHILLGVAFGIRVRRGVGDVPSRSSCDLNNGASWGECVTAVISHRWRRRHNDLSDTIHRCIGWRNSWEWFELYGYGMHILLGVAFAIRVRPGVGEDRKSVVQGRSNGASWGECVNEDISHRWRRRHDDL